MNNEKQVKNELEQLRLQLVQYFLDNPGISYTLFAKLNDLSQPTISRFCKNDGTQGNLLPSTQQKILNGIGGKRMVNETEEIIRLRMENAELKGIIKGLRMSTDPPRGTTEEEV